jgi:hypothetical protein
VPAGELAGVEGTGSACLFGSWAARYAGQAGRPPAGLDVLVTGAPDRDEPDDAAQRAASRLAREVNVTIRSPAWRGEGTDGFHVDVTPHPLVPLSGTVTAQFGSSIRALRSFSRPRRARNSFEYPGTETPGPSEDDVKDATGVAREVNDAAGKILESGTLSPWQVTQAPARGPAHSPAMRASQGEFSRSTGRS